MSIWSRLFGRGPPGEVPAQPAAEVVENGFTIRAEPYRAEGGQYQTAGRLLKEIDGIVQEHRFVRADRFATREAAADFALMKGRQIVAEQGERVFGPGAARTPPG